MLEKIANLIVILGAIVTAIVAFLHFDERLRIVEGEREFWPAGTYGILKSGTCPDGWSSQTGQFGSIKLQSLNDQHVITAQFGDSIIDGKVIDGQGNIGQLTMNVCMKIK